MKFKSTNLLVLTLLLIALPYLLAAPISVGGSNEESSNSLLVPRAGGAIGDTLEAASEAKNWMFGLSRSAFVRGAVDTGKQPEVGSIDPILVEHPSSDLHSPLRDLALVRSDTERATQPPDSVSASTIDHASALPSAPSPSASEMAHNMAHASLNDDSVRELPLHVSWSRKSARGSVVESEADLQSQPTQLAVDWRLPYDTNWSNRRARGNGGIRTRTASISSRWPIRKTEARADGASVQPQRSKLSIASSSQQPDWTLDSAARRTSGGAKRRIQKGDARIDKLQRLKEENLRKLLAENPDVRGPNGGRLKGSRFDSPEAKRRAETQRQREVRQWKKDNPGVPLSERRRLRENEGDKRVRQNQSKKISKRRAKERKRLEAYIAAQLQSGSDHSPNALAEQQFENEPALV